MGGISAALRKRLLKGDVSEMATVKEVAGAAYEPYIYSKPVFSTPDVAVRDVRDKRGNHIRQEFLGGYYGPDDKLIYFEEFSTPAGAEGALLDKWDIPSEQFITGNATHYLAYIDASLTWATWRKWAKGFPLRAWRTERFSWNLVSEDTDGLVDAIQETNPCQHTEGFANQKLGFCDQCGKWILDALPERVRLGADGKPIEEPKSLYSWRSL